MRLVKAWIYRLAISGIGIALASCGETDSDEATSTGVYSETSTTKVGSLSAIPDVGTLLVAASDDSGLRLQSSADAVVGTPPAFSSINGDNIEEYLISDINTLVTNLVSAAGSNDWDQFDIYMQSFRDGQNKCYIMQDAARQISELSSASTSSCYMKRIDAEDGDRLVEYVSGEEVAQGQFFAPSSETVYRALQLKNQPDARDGNETIIFEIQGTSVESGIYQVSLNFCSEDNELRNKEIIHVDNNQGLLTITNKNNGTEEYEGESFSHAFDLVLSAGLLTADDGTISFDPSSSRKMDIKGSFSSSGSSDTFNGSITVSDSKLTTKFITKGSHTWDDNTYKFSESGVSIVRYTGNTMKDVAIYEGTGKRKGTFTDPNQSEPFTHSGSITFEYNENESPKYATAETTDLSTALDEIDMDTDELLSQTEPTAPSVTLDNSVCSQTPSSTYSLDMSQSAMQTIGKACEAHFEGGDRICENIRQKEDQVWAKLNERENNN